MKLSKVMLGLATVLCLTACGKGKECTIEDFAKEVKEIKARSDLKKAVVSCEITIKTTKPSYW